MKNINKEIFEMVLSEMEVFNQCIIEDNKLTAEEKEELLFDIEAIGNNEEVRNRCIEAMKTSLLKYVLYSFKEVSCDKAMGIITEIFEDSFLYTNFNC